jgi:Leucine-rich repeat (LRR) protein
MSPLVNSSLKRIERTELTSHISINPRSPRENKIFDNTKNSGQIKKHQIFVQQAVRPKTIGSNPENKLEIISEQYFIAVTEVKKENISEKELINEPSGPGKELSESVKDLNEQIVEDQKIDTHILPETEPHHSEIEQIHFESNFEVEKIREITKPLKQELKELKIDEDIIDESEVMLLEMEELLLGSTNVISKNLQKFLNHLNRDYGIRSISERDFFHENGYFVTRNFISHLNLSYFRDKEILSKLLINELDSFQNLEMLDIRGNELTPDMIEPIFQLKKLKSLNLSKNNINKLSDKLNTLYYLQTLYISDLPITEIPDLHNLKNLSEINLSGSDIQSLSDSLLSLQNLKIINVFSTPITAEDKILNQLKAFGVHIVI